MLRRILDHDVHLATHGSGPTLMAIHGGPGLDHTYLRPWLDPLGEARTLVYYDSLGGGRSQRDVEIGDGIEPWVNELEAIHASLGDEPVDLVGHSFGGFVALGYAIRHPERVRRLIIAASGATLDDPQRSFARAAARATQDQLTALQTLFTPPLKDDETVRSLWRLALPVYMHRRNDAFTRAFFDQTSFCARVTSHALTRCLPTYDVRGNVGTIRAPTLVLAGRHDWVFPPEMGQALADAIPGAQIVTFEESGHILFAEEPERFVAVVRSFLNEAKRAI